MNWQSVFSTLSLLDLVFAALLVFQLPAAVRLLVHLVQTVFRNPPVGPTPLQPNQLPLDPSLVGSVSVLVPTLNEVHRLEPCLLGLMQQGPEVREILIIDSNSQDGTRKLVRQYAQRDARIKLLTDTPLPSGWVGRPWALHYGYRQSSPQSQYVLGIDADTQPQPGLVKTLVTRARQDACDLVSLSPRFIVRSAGEAGLHSALLTTLLYRTNSWGNGPATEQQVLANGQCFLSRRAVLDAVGGYACARNSFCDDVTLARHVAKAGFRVQMLDGAQLIKVRMYEGVAETWREWGRSLDLKDASTAPQLRSDLHLLLTVQALPILLLAGFALGILTGMTYSWVGLALLGLNALLLGLRLILHVATAHCYDWTGASVGLGYWLSPLLDPLAVLRIFLSAYRVPTHWRGRTYLPQLR